MCHQISRDGAISYLYTQNCKGVIRTIKSEGFIEANAYSSPLLFFGFYAKHWIVSMLIFISLQHLWELNLHFFLVFQVIIAFVSGKKKWWTGSMIEVNRLNHMKIKDMRFSWRTKLVFEFRKRFSWKGINLWRTIFKMRREANKRIQWNVVYYFRHHCSTVFGSEDKFCLL